MAKSSKQDSEVVMERRNTERRDSKERRQKDEPVAVERRKIERREKVNRRRQIDPTTCERDYTGDEIEFMQAMDAYKRRSGRMFPTCSEILEVVREIGYVKVSAVDGNAAASESEIATGADAAIEEYSDADDSDGDAE